MEVQAAFTLSGERTNIVFYSEVRLDDVWRIREVGAGWPSLMLALQDQHSAPFSPHPGPRARVDRTLGHQRAG